MTKSEKLKIIKGWMDSEDFLEDIQAGGDQFLIDKIMDELEVGTEKTAKNYLAEIRNPKPDSKIVAIAKGYKSPLEEKWEELVDFDSKTYAFLEVEMRDFNRKGQHISKPRVVSYNNLDLVQFKGKKVKKKLGANKVEVEVWAIPSQKEAAGLSVNAVLHIPKKFGVKIEVDEWEVLPK